jgi:hypothetical protein
MGFVQTTLEAIVSGIFTVAVFLFIVKFVSVKSQLAIFGIFNKWLVLAALLGTFGFTKHEIGYYLTIESSYCKQTSVCERILANKHPSIIEKLKSGLGFLENVWFENIGEGLVFIIVGMPTFLLSDNKIIAAFITGILAHLVTENSGFHNYFCRTSCSVNPLVNS